MDPSLSIVVITWNEQANVADCLGAIARQTRRDLEVIVVDARSPDATGRIVRHHQSAYPMPLRLALVPRHAPIGMARNHGVMLAHAPHVAFVSADAEIRPEWADRALEALRTHDLVVGRQIHAPRRWSPGTAVRGLRYHFPDRHVPDPLPYASNVAAAYRKGLLKRFPFSADANAAEDLLLARRAARAGYRVAYDPGLMVDHHDVASARDEWRKNLREGRAWGAQVRELGAVPALGLWVLLLAAAITAWTMDTIPLGLRLAVTAAVLWLPALRRAFRRRRAMPAHALFLGVLASPPFDLAFLAGYLRGLVRPHPRRAAPSLGVRH